jgi:uncharacterized protein YjbJ (UPF0337 family)
MDKDRAEGAARQVKGAVKEAVGKVTGDSKPKPKARLKKQPARSRTPLEA